MTDAPEFDATDVEVAVLDGTVTLNGAVADRRARRRAEEICDSVTGVRDVDNGLRLPPTTGGARRLT
jgi:osmotically-inducible protein OsmY